jgi:aspartyl-tRNA(Asn)/glutamyl-tRNA(Gln) amidotransferase subunit B
MKTNKLGTEGVKIGLEAHCQLTSLKTKLFCSCSANYRGKKPNTLVCPVCLGIPGSLPVLNLRAVESALMVALALNCKIPSRTFFFRKNYYYPDMSKNFQISQYDRAGGSPLSVDGSVYIRVDHKRKKIRIRRVHLEEDPARLVYTGTIDASPYTLIDYNRSGVALLEIVTEPDLSSPREARIFLQKLRSILEHLGVSDGGLEGAMRCDANISIIGGPRVEIKNISSFKEVERALNFEIARQKDLVSKGISVAQETRHWDETRRVTISLRMKEEEHDYRYFPELDLIPIDITKSWLAELKSKMPELPDARRIRLIKEYGLPSYDAEVLTSDKSLADFFESCVKLGKAPKTVSNWLMTDVLRCLHNLNLELTESRFTPEQLVEMISLIEDGVISGKIAKMILPEMIKTGQSPRLIVKERGLVKISGREELKLLIKQVCEENPNAVEDALKDEKAIHFLIGKLMQKTRGRADPELADELIRAHLALLKSRVSTA